MREPVTRFELLERAAAAGWPVVTIRGLHLATETAWRELVWTLIASERRALFEELAPLERRRGGAVAEVER